eukprot:TRINITY_DN5484_c1_g1_i1.p1 TRINITY_DN5484_c1_g1~~TRINITY_DN5484_c1_g1_i1.p1  ORF type:complete len:469 (-),score=11.46 TRINITY_DN5484_c1_g1_i1:360-1622(-)
MRACITEHRQSFAERMHPLILIVILSWSHKYAESAGMQELTSAGYNLTKYLSITSDKYELGTYRLTIQSDYNFQSFGLNIPVLLWHGLLDSSACWMINGINRGLAYILVDQGFDVWMGNSRGNSYSLLNQNVKASSAKFWDFSWDEMALMDIPATVDTVVQETQSQQLIYVCHSQGCLIGLAALASSQSLQQKVAKVIMLAPAVFVSHIESTPFRILAELDMGKLIQDVGITDFLPSVELVQSLTSIVCDGLPEECSNALFMLVGYDPVAMNDNMLSKYLEYYPAGTSVKNILHWSQMINYNGKKLRKFDYGLQCTYWYIFQRACNYREYGQQTPPTYNLSNISTPMYLFYGGQDLLADFLDVGILIENLNIQYVQLSEEVSSYDHLDFVLGWNANEMIYFMEVKTCQQIFQMLVFQQKI